MADPRTCATCSVELPAQRRGRPRKYCVSCVPVGSVAAWRAVNRDRVDAANAARRHDFPDKPCVVCGTTFKPRRQYDKYCGERCRNRRTKKRSSTKRKVVFQGLRHCPCGNDFQWAPRYREKFCSPRCASDARLGRAVEWRCELFRWPCEECALAFVGRQANRFCSRRCESRWWGRARYVNTPTREYQCEQCGQAFVRSGRHGKPRYCSRECYQQTDVYRDMRSRYAHNRRVRLRGGEKVYRSRIFERDGWVCQLCHRKVDPDLKWPHPLSASIDHIIPAAADGTHEPLNVQLAHLRCNSLRREVGPAQLILFGEIAA